MPKISIIVPVYKVEPYLCRCVDSILGQTFADFEVILVDDGSPDRCPEICDAYARQDRRVAVIHKKNGGPSAARNAGLDAATGEYIYFVDSDDWLSCDLLEVVQPYLGKYDLVQFMYYFATDNTAERVTQLRPGSFHMADERENLAFIIQELLNLNVTWAVWAGIYKRDLIEAYDLRFPDGIYFAEDMWFKLCYCSHSSDIIILDEPLYYYYQRAGTITKTQQNVLLADQFNNLSKKLLRHYKTYNMMNLYYDTFPIIHFMIFRSELRRYMNHSDCSVPEMRNKLLQNIEDFDYFAKWMQYLRKNREWLVSIYKKELLEFELSLAEYCATGRKDILFKINCINAYFKCRTKAGQLLRLLKLK